MEKLIRYSLALMPPPCLSIHFCAAARTREHGFESVIDALESVVGCSQKACLVTTELWTVPSLGLSTPATMHAGRRSDEGERWSPLITRALTLKP
eukprot:1191136-Prorocentrum_minimum.AAC.6